MASQNVEQKANLGINRYKTLRKMPSTRITDPLLPGRLYHIYNRGNDKSRIFFTDANYQHFVNKYKYYMENWVQTYAYCFIPNHFHLLVEINESNDPNYHKIVSQQFRKFFICYALAINKQQKRKGSLFQKPFRRVVIRSTWHLKRIVYYIHNNPTKHNLTNDFRTFRHSSYRDIIEKREGFVEFNTVLSWYNDLEEFIEYHEYLSEQ